MNAYYIKGTFKVLWSDGYFCNLICDGTYWKLEGKSLKFNNLESLEKHYKGVIKTFERIS